MSVATDNSVGTSTAQAAGAAPPVVSSSTTASAALHKAADAASSAASAPAPTSGTTTPAAGNGRPGSTEPAISAPAASVSAGTAQPATREPIPFDRHEAALRNLRSEYAWVHSIPPNAAPFVREFATNPTAFIARLSAEIEDNLRQATRQPAAPAALPEPDLVSEDGRYKTYSSEALSKIREADQRKVRDDLLAELAPVIDFYKSETQTRQQTQVRTQAESEAGDALAQAKDLPHFWDNRAKIAEKLAAMDPSIRQRFGAVAAMHMAYAQVLKESVLPALGTQAEQNVRDEYKRKANAASGSVNPADASSGSGQAPVLRNQSDLAKHLERLHAASA